MLEKSGNEEDESWTQTLTMVTPEEDATIRTITETTVVSAPGDTPLDLGLNQIADRHTVQINTMRRALFVDSAELGERLIHSDVGCQTILQGVPEVELPSSCANEVTQTMFMGNISPLTRPFRDITRIMNDRIAPVAARITESAQTVVTFEPNSSKNYIADRLTNALATEQPREDDAAERATAAASTYATDNLYFILERVFWLTDPGYRPAEVKLKDAAEQTYIMYDHGLGKVILDADTQTSLTCEPRRSNTGLLSEWLATKELARDIIDECVEIGVRPRTIVHSILDEVVERCVGQIHLPYRDTAVQTLAPCNALNDKDDEVLRKLRLEVVTDTIESSVIVLPLVKILVETACLEVRRDASVVAADILNRIQKNSATIAIRLAAIRLEAGSHRKPMADIFDARKKRLKELLRDRTETKQCSGTQTELAGVPEIGKVKEPRETVCSTCPRHSGCYVCEASLDNGPETAVGKSQNVVRDRILKTQDILIAYNPCYVVTTPSDIPKNRPHAIPRRLPGNIPSRPPLQASVSSSSSREPNTGGSKRDSVCPPGPRSARSQRSQNRGSLTDWARVVQETSSASGAWSIRGSSSTDSNTIGRQVGQSSPNCPPRNPLDKGCSRSGCDLPMRSMKALRVLKNTFIRNEESCSDCPYDDNDRDEQGVKPGQGGVVGRTGPTCVIHGGELSETVGKEIVDREQLCNITGTVRGARPNERPDSESVRVVPIIHLVKQINNKK